MNWVLACIIVTSQGVSATTNTYGSQEACIKAGEAFVAKTKAIIAQKHGHAEADYACTPYR